MYLCNTKAIKMKPKNFDNSWLGIIGTTVAILYIEDKAVGTCLDTPNAIAYAMANNPKITKAKGLLGTKIRKDLESRFWFTKENHDYFSNKINYFK